MNQQQRPLHHFTSTEINAYARALRARVVDILRATGRSREADDVAQNVALQFTRSANTIMTDYPLATTYASVCANHAFVSLQRTERVQRCEGANLKRITNGGCATGRTTVSGNAVSFDGDRELFDTLDLSSGEFDDDFAVADETRRMLDACLIGLDETDRELLYLVDGMGYQVTEVAQMVGQARETLSRKLTRIRRQVQSAASEFAFAA